MRGRPDVTRVRMAEYAVGTGAMRSNGLGSCVAVALVDPEAGVGGLAHVMLPDSDRRSGEPPAKFADTAIPHLGREVVAAGGSRRRLRAKFAGGSDLFEFSGVGERIGERNAEAVRRALTEAGIPIDGTDTGGDYGRTVTLDPRTGTLRIETADGDEQTL
ncbi:chemotaxis protein CheD [Salinirubrum litoreum]|uniref:Probable chemoreceptor glutamine deamidase CheD n=1 Tax=Salinirubrum litoreum TaxID=1126234 RepID=A0ABD5R819_9EURY|nr:chemotaxis protein CheD [Salinirubrum litoreum]